jgi:hypothetical protein
MTLSTANYNYLHHADPEKLREQKNACYFADFLYYEPRLFNNAAESNLSPALHIIDL